MPVIKMPLAQSMESLIPQRQVAMAMMIMIVAASTLVVKSSQLGF